MHHNYGHTLRTSGHPRFFICSHTSYTACAPDALLFVTLLFCWHTLRFSSVFFCLFVCLGFFFFFVPRVVRYILHYGSKLLQSRFYSHASFMLARARTHTHTHTHTHTQTHTHTHTHTHCAISPDPLWLTRLKPPAN